MTQKASRGEQSPTAAGGMTVPELRQATDAAAEPARLRLDALLTELMERASEVLETQGRLRGLLDAVVSIGEDLSLAAVLHRIVTAACQLVSARFGALGVLSSDGHGLSDFVTVGLTADEVAAIGDLPAGRGILGVLIDEPRPLLLHRLGDHPQSHGFPPGHPPMSSFLGVPVRTRSRVFGNLYLTEKADGKDFTEEDEQLVVALAAAAGVAIENAQLFDAQQRRQLWLTASTEIRSVTLAGGARSAVTGMIVNEARNAAGAELAALLLPSGQESKLTVQAATEEGLTSQRLDTTGLAIEAAMDTGSVGTVDGLADCGTFDDLPAGLSERVGRCVIAPLGRSESGQSLGVLLVGYLKGVRAPEVEKEYIGGFAGQAGIALTLAQAQQDRERLVVLEDRDRIARDLHDLVIQRLFATGMTLQSTAPFIDNPRAVMRLAGVVDDLDATIRDLRQAIYELQVPAADDDLRAEIQRTVDQATQGSGLQARVHFSGLVASAVPDGLRPQLLAVLREAVSNTVRHASASTIDITVAVDREVILTVDDDGVGIDPSISRRSGLANIASRASEFGGELRLAEGERGVGTRLIWRVPLAGDTVAPV